MTHATPAATELALAALRRIGWPWAGDLASGDVADPAWRDCFAQHPGARPARVIEQHRSGYIVADAAAAAGLAEGRDTGFAVESLPEWLRASGYRKGLVKPEDRAAVGDWVLLDGNKIVALLPRRSAIKRAAAGEHYKQQLIAANVDTVFIVCGLDGDFNPRRIERYLLLVRADGVEPVIVLTKSDLDDTDAEAAREALAGIIGQGITVLAVNARDRDSVAQLLPWLPAGASATVVGSSGAGKSTLTNTLLGVEKMKTNAVREHDARGRHTTTHRALIPLPSGACLIDTPGMRELKPTGEEDIADGGFADIEAVAADCRFRDCKHVAEPGCALRAAIEDGRLDAARVANYLKLGAEVAGATQQLAARLAKKSEAKVLGKALHKRLDDKYGKR